MAYLEFGSRQTSELLARISESITFSNICCQYSELLTLTYLCKPKLQKISPFYIVYEKIITPI